MPNLLFFSCFLGHPLFFVVVPFCDTMSGGDPDIGHGWCCFIWVPYVTMARCYIPYNGENRLHEGGIEPRTFGTKPSVIAIRPVEDEWLRIEKLSRGARKTLKDDAHGYFISVSAISSKTEAQLISNQCFPSYLHTFERWASGARWYRH